jgi:hypothetical protein
VRNLWKTLLALGAGGLVYALVKWLLDDWVTGAAYTPIPAFSEKPYLSPSTFAPSTSNPPSETAFEAVLHVTLPVAITEADARKITADAFEADTVHGSKFCVSPKKDEPFRRLKLASTIEIGSLNKRVKVEVTVAVPGTVLPGSPVFFVVTLPKEGNRPKYQGIATVLRP